VLRASRQREVDSKSNEITAVPELLDTLHLDAMGEAGQRFRQAQPDGMASGGCQKDDTLPDPCITNKG
jgi:hypothetical protein